MRPKSSDSERASLTSLGPPRSPDPAHVVELLVLRGPGHRSALVLQRLPQGFRPVPDPRPHPPEVLLGHLAEGPVGLIRRDLLSRVVEEEDRRSEPVLELVVHRNPLSFSGPTASLLEAPNPSQCVGRYSPKTSRRASETSPRVASARSASFIGCRRLPVPRAASATPASASSTFP